MNSCLDRLLSINNPCGSDTYTGIYDITDVIGFTWPKAAGIAEGNFKEYTGYQIALKARRLAARTATADLMAQMYVRGWATGLTSGQHDGGSFKKKMLGVSTNKRGIQMKAKDKCPFSGMKLLSVSVKGCSTIDTTLYIEADGVTSEIPISLVSEKVYTLTNLCDANGVNLFSGESGTITIWIEDEGFNPTEVKPNCQRCTGSPTICADSKGWSNDGSTTSINDNLAYGITATVACECNYDKILCALPNDEYKAQILRYGVQMQLAELFLNTERFNYWTIYGREETQIIKAEAEIKYRLRINEYVDSLRAWFGKNTYCGCVECYGSVTKSMV